MIRPERPAWGWRLLAWTTFILVGLLPLTAVIAEGANSLMMAAINWIAIVGTFLYAYGYEPRLLLFWRVFALPFSLYTAATLGIGMARTADFIRNDPRPTPIAVWIIAGLTLIVCGSVCVALLRFARLLRGRERAASRSLESVFA